MMHNITYTPHCNNTSPLHLVRHARDTFSVSPSSPPSTPLPPPPRNCSSSISFSFSVLLFLAGLRKRTFSTYDHSRLFLYTLCPPTPPPAPPPLPPLTTLPTPKLLSRFYFSQLDFFTRAPPFQDNYYSLCKIFQINLIDKNCKWNTKHNRNSPSIDLLRGSLKDNDDDDDDNSAHHHHQR